MDEKLIREKIRAVFAQLDIWYEHPSMSDPLGGPLRNVNSAMTDAKGSLTIADVASKLEREIVKGIIDHG
jgi:hypothetical protein